MMETLTLPEALECDLVPAHVPISAKVGHTFAFCERKSWPLGADVLVTATTPEQLQCVRELYAEMMVH